MAQEIINYGNTANDGTGDALRNAFIKVDDNFNQIWAAGPVGSNITVLNNTVAVTNTNGNLILSPNGVGIIQTNRPLYPRLDNTYDLGSANFRYRSIFVGAGGITNDGNLTLGNISNLRIPGGTNGYVIQTDGAGNLSFVAQSGSGNGSPGGANTQVQFNNSGLFGASNTFTFSNVTSTLSVGNIVTSGLVSATANIIGGNISTVGLITATGNVTANYFLGVGSQLTGNITGGNLITGGLISATGNIIGGNIRTVGVITATGNITGNYFLGNGSQLTNLPGGVIQANVPPPSPNATTLWWDEITGRLYVWYTDVDGSQWVDAAPAQGGYGNSNVASYLAVGGITTAISTTGNISGNYFIGNGSQLTGISSGIQSRIVNGNSNVNIATANGNVTVKSANNIWAFENDGNLDVPGNINCVNTSNTAPSLHNFFSISSAANFAVITDEASTVRTWAFDNTGALSLPTNGDLNFVAGGIKQALNQDLYIHASDDAANGWSIYNVVDDGAGNILTQTRLAYNDFTVTTNIQSASPYTWNFGSTGNLTLPGNTFAVKYANGTAVSLGGGNTGNVTFNNQAVVGTGNQEGGSGLYLAPGTESVGNLQYLRVRGGDLPTHIHLDTGNNTYFDQYFGDDNKYIQLANTGNIVINSNDGVGNTAQWNFGTDGNLTAPGNVSAVGNISATGNVTANYFIGDGSQLTGITASVPSQTILPTIQTITVVARPAGLFGGGQGGANVTVANTIPVTEYGVIITDGTVSEKYKTGSLGSIPGTVSLTFDTGLNSTQFTVFAYVTSNAGTFYSNSATGTSGICLVAGTQIALSDGTHKAIEHITYTDKLLSWDFDRGCYAETTAMWIKRGETGSQYNLLTFSDGTTLRTFDQHRIFNKQAGAFTYPMTDATPVGTITVNEHGQEITLTNKQVIVDTIEYYNVITHYHMNLFSDSVLTSCRFNNIYPITDMKFVKDGRTLRTKDEFENVEDRFFHGLRLAEQTTGIETVKWYVNRLISTEVSTQLELTF